MKNNLIKRREKEPYKDASSPFEELSTFLTLSPLTVSKKHIKVTEAVLAHTYAIALIISIVSSPVLETGVIKYDERERKKELEMSMEVSKKAFLLIAWRLKKAI